MAITSLIALLLAPAVFGQELDKSTRGNEAVESAQQLIEQSKVSEAISLLTEAIAQDSENASLYVARGDAYLNANTFKQLELAVSDYSRAIELDPQNSVAYRKRGYARWHLMERDIDGALNDFDAALKITPENSVTICCRGELFHFLGRNQEAKTDFIKAHKVDPNSEVPLNNLGFIAQKEDDLDSAIEYYSKALEIAPQYAGAYQNRGSAFFKKRDFERALADQDKSLKLRKDWLCFIERGDTKMQLGDLHGALDDYSAALQTNRFYAATSGAFTRRADVYRQLGDNTNADADLEKAKRYEP